MKIAGIIIITFGLADLIGSYTDFDLWGGFIGVDLPEVLWKYSSYIEIALGYFLMNMGSKDTETDAAVE
jgi:hypothetical protein